MKADRQIYQVLTEDLPAITRGEKTLESVLAKYPQIKNELQPRLEAALWLQQARFTLATRPGYIHDSRKYLESNIASLAPHNSWQRMLGRYSLKRWVFNVTAPIIIFLLMVLVVNSAVLTARLSIPGEPLYTSKLVIEDVQLALTFDQVKRTELNIGYSRERALEFVELVMEGEYDYLPAAAARMEKNIIASLHSIDQINAENSGAEHNLASTLKDTLDGEIQMLNMLKSTSPDSAHTGIELAINVARSGIFALP